MKNTTIILLLFVLFSCSNNKKTNDIYELKESNKKLSFNLDKNTKSFIQTLFIYEEKKSKQFLTFQNQDQNEILFYDINSSDLEFKIKPQIDGANGVGFFLGYYIHNFDSIFLTISGTEKIALINKESIVSDKIIYEKTNDEIKLTKGYSTTAIYHPAQIINDKLYIISGCNRWFEQNPVSATIDLKTKEIHALPFSYPTFPNTSNKSKRAGIEEYMSRCYTGEKFVYSFYFDESIYITNQEHSDIHKVNIKSKYIDKIKTLDDYGNLTFKDICENPNYGNLIFDKYRNIYYRVAYPETEIKNSDNSMEIMQYGRKKFSIIIIDKDFKIIGESLFPDYTYNSNLLFVLEDGLYISSSHCMNPTYNDDILSFQKFELVKK